MQPLTQRLRETADAYAERALYQSEWQTPLRLLREAAGALEMAEVDRNCLRAALKVATENGTTQTEVK